MIPVALGDGHLPAWWVVVWRDRTGRLHQNFFSSRYEATRFGTIVRRGHHSARGLKPKQTPYSTKVLDTEAICAALDATDVLLTNCLRKREGG